MRARRHERAGDVSELNERLRRRSARLNDQEAERLEREIRYHGQQATAKTMGITLAALDDVRHSGPSTPATIALVRAYLGKVGAEP
jgi:hypothetical protein